MDALCADLHTVEENILVRVLCPEGLGKQILQKIVQRFQIQALKICLIRFTAVSTMFVTEEQSCNVLSLFLQGEESDSPGCRY